MYRIFRFIKGLFCRRRLMNWQKGEQFKVGEMNNIKDIENLPDGDYFITGISGEPLKIGRKD